MSTTELAPTGLREDALQAELVESLDELAGTINRETALAEQAIIASVDHAIRAGEAILRARATVPRGSWKKWCKENLNIAYTTVSSYSRMAVYRDIVGAAPTYNSALEIVRGLPAIGVGHGPVKHDQEEIEKLHQAGWTQKEIGIYTGCPQSRVWSILQPELRKKQLERNAIRKKAARVQRRQVEAEARDAAAKSLGVSEEWTALQRLRERVSTIATTTGATPEIRLAFGQIDGLLTTAINLAAKVLKT